MERSHLSLPPPCFFHKIKSPLLRDRLFHFMSPDLKSGLFSRQSNKIIDERIKINLLLTSIKRVTSFIGFDKKFNGLDWYVEVQCCV